MPSPHEDPASLYYRLAEMRGFKSTRGLNKREVDAMVTLAEGAPEEFDKQWERLAKAGRL